MAARMNKKRSFLFVSKVLGKHIPVRPYTSLLSGAALALLLYREIMKEVEHKKSDELLEQAIQGLRNPDLAEEAYKQILNAQLSTPVSLQFIGFAETATALGHSMYQLFADKSSYIHTTREDIPDLQSVINFDEEHSHAVAHRCYALSSELLADFETVVLVDDEMTTGKTALNIIRDMQVKFPRKLYVVVSLLDWRTKEDEKAYVELEAELGVTIKSLCLLKGNIWVEGIVDLETADMSLLEGRADAAAQVQHYDDIFPSIQVSSIDSSGQVNSSPYLMATARFGIVSADNEALQWQVSEAARRLQALHPT